MLAAGSWLLAPGCWLLAPGWLLRYRPNSCLVIARLTHINDLATLVEETATLSAKSRGRNGDQSWGIASYRDLEAWQSAMELLLSISDIVSQLPNVERFGLASQMRRAAVSVPSNVAEGQAYGPSARYLHHVRLALGSLAELDSQLEAVLRVGYLTNQVLAPPLALLHQTGRLLHGLERSLKVRQAAGWGLALIGFFSLSTALLFS